MLTLMNLFMLLQEPAAQAAAAVPNYGRLGAGIGIGLAIVGLGLGMGRIGGQVAEAIARQPEAEDKIRGAGLLFGILLEGATIIALVFALLFKLIA